MDQRFHFDNAHINDPLIFGDIRLYQVGRLYSLNTEGKEIGRAHFHQDWFELTIVTEGSGYVVTNDVAIPVNSGEIYLSFPYETHMIKTDNDTAFKYDFIAFNTDIPDIKNDLEQIRCLFNSPELRCFQDEKLNQLVNNCILEFCDDDQHKDLIIQSTLTLILHYLIRDFSGNTNSIRSRYEKNEILCFKIMHYIDTHLRTLTSLHQVAEEFNYNYTYLSGMFKKVAKISLSKYYNEKKLLLAKKLIVEDKMKISQVASELNYSNPYAFSKAFKKHFGISPKHMQEQESE